MTSAYRAAPLNLNKSQPPIPVHAIPIGRVPPPIPPRPAAKLATAVASSPPPNCANPPSPARPASPESELCGCALCPQVRASLSPSPTTGSSTSPAGTSQTTDVSGSRTTDATTSQKAEAYRRRTTDAWRGHKASTSSGSASTGKKRRIKAKAHLAPTRGSDDIVLSLDDLPAWTIGFPPDRRVKDALMLSLSCGGVEVECEGDIGALMHDSGLDMGDNPRLADMTWARGCHFTFHFWTRTPLRSPESPRRSSRSSLGASPPHGSLVDAWSRDPYEEQRIARQNDPAFVRRNRILRRLNPFRQTERFNALTVMDLEGTPDGLGGVYTRDDLEYVRAKMIRFAPVDWEHKAWYRDGLAEMGLATFR